MNGTRKRGIQMKKMTNKEFKRVMTELAEIDMNDDGYAHICMMLINYFFENGKYLESNNYIYSSKFERKRANALYNYLDELGYYKDIESEVK